MGTFDYEHLRSTIKDYCYVVYNDVFSENFSRDFVIQNSYDGILYEKKTIERIVGYESDLKTPKYNGFYSYTPAINLNILSQKEAKEEISKYKNDTVFAYKTKNVSNSVENSDANISQFSKLLKNPTYFYPISKSLRFYKPISFFNEKIFNVTKLREEIYFINVKITEIQENTDSIPKVNNVILAVNDLSFWNRFRIENIVNLETNEIVMMNRQKFNNSALELIIDCINNPNHYIIKMRYINDEESKQRNYFTNIHQSIESSENEDDEYSPESESTFINPKTSILEFTGVTHYNKRTWLAILGDHGIFYSNEESNPFLGSYKSENSNTYYLGDDNKLCMVYR